MRIVVINTAASSGGAMSILKSFYQYIKENDSENEWIFFLSDYYIEETDNITVRVVKESKNKINRFSLDNFHGHRLISRFNPDVVFSMQNTTVANLSVPQILYLHQAIPFQEIKNYSFFNKEEYQLAFIQHFLGANIKYGLKRASKIIVQTHWMRDAIVEQANVNYEDVFVAPPSINNKEEILGLAKEFKSNSFFYPSSSMPYKNNSLIEDACNYIDSIHPNLDYRVDITVEESFGNNHIHSIGKIPRFEVFNKMSNEVLIFPSYIETFGLPLEEGKIANSLIFASDTPFSREILQSYNNGYFFNPFDKKELGELMISSIKGQINKSPQIKESVLYNDSWEKVHQLLLNINTSNNHY